LRHPVALGIAASLAAWSARAQARHEFTEVHMGLSVHVVLYAHHDSVARAAARAAFARIAMLDNMMSDYRSQSDLRAIEANAGEWVPAPAEMFEVIQTALRMASLTDGAFDPTVAPLVALWRTARQTKALPARAEIEAARARVGWRRVALDTVRRLVRLDPGMRLDLGGIAKGYILEQALRVIREAGVTSALVEGGGDIVVGDAPPGRRGWHIDTPGASTELVTRARELANSAISTSGASAQYVEIGGVRYSHVVDPRTGIGLTNQLTARVIATDAAVADALSTALTVLGLDRAAAVVARFPGVVADVR
jgi:thiamine biosynthesis lipoprotein